MICSSCKKQRLSGQVDYVNSTTPNRCSSCGGPLSEEEELGQAKDKEQENHILLKFVVLLVIALPVIIVLLFLFFSKGVDIPPEALENPEYGLPVID